VNELAEPYDVTVQAVSKHLKVLEEAGLVSRTREAQRRQAEERYRRLDDVLRSLPDDDATPKPPTDPT
jgi:DNA-binding transcriptional ArsR family regulator